MAGKSPNTEKSQRLTQNEIKQQLVGATQQQIAWFTARCALRVLPYLVEGAANLRFWQKDRQPKHLHNICRAHNAALTCANSTEWNTKDKTAASAAAAASADAAFASAFASASAAAAAAASADAAVEMRSDLDYLQTHPNTTLITGWNQCPL